MRALASGRKQVVRYSGVAPRTYDRDVINPGGGFRPDENAQLQDIRHERQAEYAANEAVANQLKPSWWLRLKAKFRQAKGER
jgi:hypothetical protein